MEKNRSNKPILETNDIFDEAFKKYSESSLAEKLNEKFRVKPYHEKFRNLKISSLITSYLFNIISALAASTLVFLFVKQFVSGRLGETASFGFAIVITLIFIVILELKKREVLSRFFVDLFQFGKFRMGLAAISLLIFGISVSFSYFGGKWAIVEFTPEPEMIHKDSMEMNLIAKMDKLDERILKAENTSWRGVTTRSGSESRTEFQKEKLLLSSRLLEIQRSEESSNGLILVEHESSVKLSAANFSLTVVGCEILFVLVLMFGEFYDYRSHSEMVVGTETVSDHFDPSIEVSAVSEHKVPGTVLGTEVSGMVVSEHKVPGIGVPHLETIEINTVLETMKTVIDGTTGVSELASLRSFKKSLQRYSSKRGTEKGGKVSTCNKNIFRAIQDFEKESGTVVYEV